MEVESALVHFIYKLSEFIAFLQRKAVAIPVSRYYIQTFYWEQTFAEINDLADIIEKYLKIKSVGLLIKSFKIQPLISNYQFPLYSVVVNNLVCITGFQNNLICI